VLRETFLFLRHLINEDRPGAKCFGANYSFLNQHLATPNGIKDSVSPEHGHEFRKIQFANTQRGGLPGQGGVLAVSANGLEASPVVRGVWTLENILAMPLSPPLSPPPDGVPAIEPDVRDATSIHD